MWRKRLASLALSLLAVVAVAIPALAGVGGSRYEYLNTGDDNQDSISTTQSVAQTFTPSVTHNITSVKLLLYRSGTPEILTVNITTTSGLLPTTTVLASGTSNGSTLPTGSPYEWRVVSLGAGTILSADTRYAIACSSAAYVYWRTDINAGYANGQAAITIGGVWYGTSYDLMFEEWGNGYVNPAITSDNATLIGMTSARLNSTLTSQGDAFDNCTVMFGYDNVTQTAANFASYANTINASGTWTTGQHPYLDVTTLTANRTYYYRAKATNSYNSTVTATERTFTTLTAVGTVSGVTANPSNTSMQLHWTKASGSTNTSVQYRIDTYPTSYSDASNSMGYNGTAVDCTITGLTAGQTYFFALWGFNSIANYSASSANIVMTTLAYAVPGGGASSPKVTLPIPTVPANAAQSPNITAFNMEPFTSIIAYSNNATGGFGMPVENAWETIALLVIVGISVTTYIKLRNIFLSFAVMFMFTWLAVGLHLTQAWLLVVEGLVAVGVWGIDRFAQ